MCSKLLKSPIFYMGNKYKLLPQLLPLFPKNINKFYDLFGGSGCVSGNVDAKNIIYNELNENIYDLFCMFENLGSTSIIQAVEGNIERFGLNREGTDVRQNIPNIKETKEYYNEKYLDFRDYYNKHQDNITDLYTLTFYSFSNLIRFNSKSEFNMPYGNRCFCEKHKEQIIDWCDMLEHKNIIAFCSDYKNVLEQYMPNKNDFVYVDPPYYNTLAIYNEKRAFGGWTIESDYELFDILEDLDMKGVKWGMSNVFVNKGNVNEHLIKWCEENNWYVYHLNKTYSALGKGNANSDEVYICNYLENKWEDLD